MLNAPPLLPSDQPPPERKGVGYWLGFAVGFTTRWVLRLALLFLLLLLLSFFLIQVPVVQRYAAGQASEALAEALEVEVRVGTIAIEPFTKLRLEDVFIGDRTGDTLVQAGAIRANLFQPLRSLYNRTLFVEGLELEGAYVKLRRDTASPSGNYAFLSEFFAPAPSTAYEERDPFQFDLRSLAAHDTRFAFEDDFAGTRLAAQLDSLGLLLNVLDLPAKRIDAERLSVAGLRTQLTRFAGAPAVPDPGDSTRSATDPARAPDTNRAFLLPFDIAVDAVDLERIGFRYDDERGGARVTGPEFDPRHIAIRDLQLGLRNLSLGPDSLGLEVQGLAFEEASGIKLDNLSASTVSFTERAASVRGLAVATNESRLGSDLQVSLPPSATWEDAAELGVFDVTLAPSQIQVGELLAFVPSLRENSLLATRSEDKISLAGRARGTVDQLRIDDLAVSLPDGSYLRADASLRNLTNPAEALLNVEVSKLNTSVARLSALVPSLSIPPRFEKLGQLEFTGRFDGFLHDFVAYGDLRTNLGQATLDTRFVSTEGQKEQYSGELALVGFDLGAFLGVDDLDAITAEVEIQEGSGLRADNAELALRGLIAEVIYRGYTYRGVRVNGTVAPGSFEGELELADEHADLDFNGKIDLQPGRELFDFGLQVRKVDLGPLGLSPEPWSFTGNVEIESTSLDIDNLVGRVSIEGFTLDHADGRSYALDRIVASQFAAPDGSKRLSVESPLLVADLSGDYRLRTLPKSVRAAFETNYPELYKNIGLAPVSGPVDTLDTRISLSAKALALDSLMAALNVPVSRLDGSDLALTLDTRQRRLDLSLTSSAPQVGGVGFDRLSVDVRGVSGELAVTGRAAALDLGRYGFGDLEVYSEYADGDLRFSIAADTASSVLGAVSLAGAIHIADTAVAFTLDPTSYLFIGGERWTVEPGNELVLGNRRVITHDFELRAGERFVMVETVGERGLNVLLRQFNLEILNAYLNPDKLRVAGAIDAYFSAEDLYAGEGINFTASVDTFTINDVDWGALQALVTLPDPGRPATVYTTFSRLGQQAVLDASIALRDSVLVGGEPRPAQYFDAKLGSENFDMSFLGYLIPGIMDLRGRLGADLHVSGTPDDMVPEGGIQIDAAALTIDYLKTRYFIDGQYVSIDARSLDASGRQITDRFGNTAVITGGLTHRGLKEWALDVSLSTQRLHVLNTNRYDNPVYYGQAFARGKVAFTGSFPQSNIDIYARALDNSKVVFPVAGTGTAADLRFIRFRQPEDSTVQEVATFLRGANVDMEIEIDPRAELLLIFDEAAGDILRTQGTGDIKIQSRRTGTYGMYGKYEVDLGEYLFTLLNVINKPFSILKGGVIQWDGDPFTAKLDITARYDGLSAAPASLIAGLTNETLPGANTRTPVDLLMKLTGDLQRPNIDFNIDLPDVDGEVKGLVDTRLALMRQDPNELNKQVFGLIVVGQFLPQSEGLNVGAETIGFNTVSELFSNQFSYLLTELFSSLAGPNGALSGIDIDVNLQGNSSLTGSGAYGRNDLATYLRTYFFDDRLAVGVGANFGNRGGSSGQLTAGNFEVSYALTEDRRLSLKTYASTNEYLGVLRRNRGGVGISWRREFDSFQQLFGAVEAAEPAETGSIIFDNN